MRSDDRAPTMLSLTTPTRPKTDRRPKIQERTRRRQTKAANALDEKMGLASAAKDLERKVKAGTRLHRRTPGSPIRAVKEANVNALNHQRLRRRAPVHP